MLRNVLVAYLERVKEREFDLTFMALLSSLGFYDIHFTHGQVEFGKDFIAKNRVESMEVQYSFQSKAGDIGQTEWRNDVMGQMLESVLVSLSHPHFSREMPHQSVLVTTGHLLGNVRIALQDLNDKIKDEYHRLPIEVWERESLLPKNRTKWT